MRHDLQFRVMRPSRGERAAQDLAPLAHTVLGPYLEPLSLLHRVLCPRQVLGVRVALFASRWLGVPFPQTDKRALILTEIDGCFADGLSVVSGCSLGHRTIRLVDFGKLAATVLDTSTRRAVRVWPEPSIRVAACAYAEGESRRWHAQRVGYARMPDTELLLARSVDVPAELEPLLGPLGRRTACIRCGEEVLNAREVLVADGALCRGCAREVDGDAAGR